MKKNNNKKSVLDRILEAVSILILAVTAGFTAYNRGNLPELLPVHIGLDGNFDSYINSPYAIYTLIGLAGLGLISLIASAENLAISKNMSPTVIRVVALEGVFTIAYMQLSMVNALIENKNGIGKFYLVLVGVMLLTVLLGKLGNKFLNKPAY